MGMFSYNCSNCGSHDQFDWVDDCVVTLKNTVSGEIYHVKGEYDGYGKVVVLDDNSHLHYIFPLQFKQYFHTWAIGQHNSPKLNISIVSNDIYCNGKNVDNINRLCINEQLLTDVLDYIPSSIFDQLQRWEEYI